MAVDESLLRACAAGQSPAVLRLYAWEPHALSIGAHQDAERAANLDWIRHNGLDIVRRPTGGRAVLHGRELTYALAAPSTWGGITETYRLLAEALVAGLRGLGIDAMVARGRSRRVPTERNLPCFTSPARYEILWRGRKIVGSAQRQVEGGFLQHGSIPFEQDEERVRLATENAALQGGWMAGLEEAAGRGLQLDEVAAAMRAGFERVLGPDCEEGGLTSGESREAAALRENKYATRGWNLQGRRPTPVGRTSC